MKNYIIIGLPASGKGTLSQQISKHFGLCHISTGDMLREERDKGSKIGKKIGSLIDNGKYVSDEIIIPMVLDRISDSKKGFVFDGFPRTKVQSDRLISFLNERKTPIDFVIYLDVSQDTIVDRIKKRSLIENRPDDVVDVIKDRVDQYRMMTEPLLEYFREENMNMVIVDGSPSKEEVFDQVLKMINR